MLEGHIFSYKEIRHHNLSKSSDVPIIYARVLPLSASVTGANTHDMKAAIVTLDSVIVKRPSYKQNRCLNKGYDFADLSLWEIGDKGTTIDPEFGYNENQDDEKNMWGR